jgi:hypothetical protein
MNIEHIGDPKLGMLVYKNALPEDLEIISRLEKTIGNSTTAPFMWMEALVGHAQKMPEYRDCVDCKIGDIHLKHLPPQYEELRNVYNDTATAIKNCMSNYQSRYNINMQYMEAINFIRYSAGQHFQVHTDHGFSYTCTVSSVVYMNDDYDGGELWFPYLDISYKASAGDIVLFPSTYIYAHAAKPVTKGTKYSAVTMFDYNDRNHDIKGSHDGVAAPAPY